MIGGKQAPNKVGLDCEQDGWNLYCELLHWLHLQREVFVKARSAIA